MNINYLLLFLGFCIVSSILFSFELAVLNVLYSFLAFHKQKLCLKTRILLQVKKGNSW